MPRRKTDPLLSALISKLPAGGADWPVEQRKAWLALMEMAFNTVYGVQATSAHVAPPKPAVVHTFMIDEEGYVRGRGGKRLNPSDISGPIYDMRGEEGDTRSIIWADESTGLNGADITIVAV